MATERHPALLESYEMDPPRTDDPAWAARREERPFSRRLMSPYLRGAIASGVVALFAWFVAASLGTRLSASLVVPWVLVALVPAVMSVVFASNDERYLHDFRAGMIPYAFGVLVAFLYGSGAPQVDYVAGMWTWYALVPLTVALFAFGVAWRHGGLRKGMQWAEHPRGALLRTALVGGAALGIALMMLSNFLDGSPTL